MPSLLARITPSTPDARGTPRPLCRLSASEIRRAAAPHNPIAAIDEAHRRTFQTIILSFNAIALVLYYTWVLRRAPTPLLIPTGLLFLVPFVFAPLQNLNFPAAVRRRDAIRDSLLAANLCPSCAYPLTTTTPDPDGLTTCPECSAPWRLNPAQPGPSS